MQNLFKRYAVLVVGLFIMAVGVDFSIKGALGTSPISSLPYVAGQVTGLTVGQATLVLHCVLIALQIALLRKNYQPVQLLQLPVGIVFSAMLDIAMGMLAAVNPAGYAARWLCCLVGIVLVGIGVSCEVTANVVVLAGEGFVLAVCKAFGTPFAKTKIGFDVTLVVLSVALSLLCLGSLQGVREGTVAAALCVGLVAKRVNVPMGAFARRFF